MENRSTLRKIDQIVNRIHVHPEYSSSVAGHFMNDLLAEAEKHSNSMELDPNIHIPRKEHDKMRAISLESLAKARLFISREGISVYSLRELGSIIEPESENKGFRKAIANTGYAVGGVELPEGSKVPYLIQNLVGYLDEEGDVHPVTRAANAHLSVVGIHPYEDGNGRAARLIQNFSLTQKSYPPAVITDSDRELYIRLLNPALKSWLSSKTPYGSHNNAEDTFREYIASKVLNSAERLEDELKRNRIYDLNFDKVKDKPMIYSIKKRLDNLNRIRTERDIQVRIKSLNHGKHAEFEIRGDIGYDELTHVLNTIHNEYKVKYSLSSRKGCVC